jgi:hypothetical protein
MKPGINPYDWLHHSVLTGLRLGAMTSALESYMEASNANVAPLAKRVLLESMIGCGLLVKPTTRSPHHLLRLRAPL